MKKPFTLGIDLGSNSIGWAMIRDEPTSGETNILAGVRVFPEGVARDTKGFEKSKNEARRLARGMRRQHQRKSRRKDTLRNALQRAGLSGWNDENPYALRRKGLEEALTLAEFGRALYHLNQRRGFKSNRKSEPSKETGQVYIENEQIAKAMTEDGSKTLGDYLAKRMSSQRIRNQHVLRDMVKYEFDLLWRTQAAIHPTVLTDDLRSCIERIIFFQRPLKPANLGKCELEPEEERLARASWFAQRFRVLQDVSNLRLLHLDGSEKELSEDQRVTLIQHLSAKKELKIEKIRELLSLEDNTRLNIESYRKDMLGNGAEAGLRRLFKKDFDKRPEFYVEEIYESAVEDEEEAFEQKARKGWHLNEEQIAGVYRILASQPKGYMHLSRKAILNLLPHMQQGGDFFRAKQAAGYEKTGENGEFVDQLPLPDGMLPNPIVRKGLFELRRVVNAIVREYGKPSRIIVELARDTKGGAKERKEQLQRNYIRSREREENLGKLRAMGLPNPSNTDELKYRLWQECREQCPFTGRMISFSALFITGEVQIEHILPYSRSLDDSQTNKTLCFVSENQWKSNRTPWEAYHQNPKQWEEIQARVSRMAAPYNKKKKFLQREIDLDRCVDRQLNDTRYMSREARAYLQRLGIAVTTTRGDVTAELRQRWGLNTILALDEEEKKDRKNRKDHRHHAIDAAVIALTTSAHLKNLARRSAFRSEGKAFPLPWPEFREELQAVVERMLVSHRVNRKISGALHEETAYGHRQSDPANVYVRRKPLESLTVAMVEKIRDPLVQKLVRQRLEEHGGDFKRAFNKENPLLMPNKKGLVIPINSVRCSEVANNMIPINDESGKPYRYVEPGSNHHISIFEYADESGTRKQTGVVRSVFECAQVAMVNGRRRKQKLPPVILISRVHPSIPNAKFLYSLSKDEMFVLDVGDETVLCRVQKFDVNGTIILRPHTYSGKVADTDKPPLIFRKSASTLTGKKVTIDPLGRLAEAHD